ncbi:MAG TPA: TrmH family RNA methyltransferase [Thermoanaerobaculaceae bacterium]|nr:TrmH family RNA methyltransferase [Thermoanaerobaculaceae bacterium]HRS14926.1 TrmH family RNA methyltransferase [Thermoanaerobaculaceae bacterium]
MDMRLVLVRPRYAGNIGSALRLAANFGVPELVLVAPACDLDDPELIRMAMGGRDLVRVTETDSLEAAVAGSDLVLATTSSRSRDQRRVLTVPQARELLASNRPHRVAAVFGPERGGLSAGELRVCHARVTVPTSPALPVLNLAQAVAIVVAGLHEGTISPPPPRSAMDHPAPWEDLSAAVAHLERALLASGVLDPQNPARVMDQVRRWLGRTVPTRREVALLRALAAHVEYLISRPRTP